MNLQKYNWPKLKDADIAFSVLDTDSKLLEEAKRLGFNKSSNPYNKLFNQLFFKGGDLDYKEGLPESFKYHATRYLKAYMTSFMPRHEHKEAICALILSELVDLKHE